MTLFIGLIASMIADSAHDVNADSTTEEVLANARTELTVRRLSPDQLYKDATGVLLNPSRQSTGIVVESGDTSALPTSLPLDQSLLLAWWQVVVLVAGTIVLFAAAYMTFMRQEVARNAPLAERPGRVAQGGQDPLHAEPPRAAPCSSFVTQNRLPSDPRGL